MFWPTWRLDLLLSFFTEQNDEGVLSDKLDFKLRITCTVFLNGIGITGDLFTELLAGPELTAAAKLSLEGVSLSQVIILLLIHLVLHFLGCWFG